jgi:hypothetical protein
MQLLLLNLALQVFDGIATWQGVGIWGEGNPLMLHAMSQLGTGAALFMFKLKSCLLLLFLWAVASRVSFVHDSFVVLATTYTLLSFIPWTARLFTLLA